MVTNESINTVDDFLAHHGILGMKWGVRRYQNEDGTRTPAGQKRDRRLKLKAEEAERAKENGKFSRSDRKIIRSKKNKLLNEYLDLQREAEDAVESKLKVSYEEAMSDETGKITKQYIDEKVKLMTEYLSKKKMPEYVKEIKYSNTNFAGDDLELFPDVILNNGSKANFMWLNISKGDDIFLDKVKHSFEDVDDFLAHHGIVGMKWGVRRYQREDGTRTPAGKKRERKAYSEDYQKMQEYKKRGKKNLSTKELQEYNTRKNLEKQFDKLSPTAYERGKTIAKSTLAVTAGVTTLYKFTTSDIGQKLIRKGKRFVSGSMRTIIAP